MDSLREFFASSSGLAPARRGLSLGWVISALTGITVLLGAKEARADDCSDLVEPVSCSYDPSCPSITPIRCTGDDGNTCCTT